MSDRTTAAPQARKPIPKALLALFRPRLLGSLSGVEIYRHRAPVRVWHWVNVLCILILLGSGLNIFNAHPRLYWGMYGADADRPFISITAMDTGSGVHGITQIGSTRWDTTGLLGWSRVGNGYAARAWPTWLTFPSYQDLADARHWHVAAAWILVLNVLTYLVWSTVTGHFRRDLWPTVTDLRDIPKSVADHVRLRPPRADEARRYNVLQKGAYLIVVCFIILMIATGMTMSPGFDAVAPWLLDVFGGRQSARSIHFLTAVGIVLFVVVHLTEVVIAGPVNEVRSIVTGRFTLPPEGAE